MWTSKENAATGRTQRRGLFHSKRYAIASILSIAASCAVMLGIIYAVVSVASAYPQGMASAVFAMGILAIGYGLVRAFWQEGGAAKFFGGVLGMLVVALAVNVIAGVL